MIGGRVLQRYADGAASDGFVMFMASDDEDAKLATSRLVRDTQLDPFDTGGLETGRLFQSLDGPLFDVRMTREEARAAIATIRDNE